MMHRNPTGSTDAALSRWSDWRSVRSMTRFHHVNLGVSPGGVEAVVSFAEVLGYRRVELDEAARARGACWLEADDGSQLHLSEDPDHRAADKAHVAIVPDDLDAVVARINEQGDQHVTILDQPGFRVALCCDPSGNHWELRTR